MKGIKTNVSKGRNKSACPERIQMTTGAAVIAYALQAEFSKERETGHSNAAKLAERIFTFPL